MSKEFLQKEITATTKEQCINYIELGYGVICLDGEWKDEIISKVNKYQKGNKVSNWAIVIGLVFWPLLIAGGAGKLAMGATKNYKFAEMSGQRIALVHKKYNAKG